jgi:hypothetical protein
MIKNAYKLTLLSGILFILAFHTSAQTGENSSQTEPESAGVEILQFADPDEMFELLEGKWATPETACADPAVIGVSRDRKNIIFTQSLTAEDKKRGVRGTKKTFVYSVLEVTNYYIRTQIKGETRRTDEGHLIQWDFSFVSRNDFRWRRSDWGGALTDAIRRCPAEKD